jgi:hypothetical protein
MLPVGATGKREKERIPCSQEPIISQLNPILTLPSQFFKIHFIVITVFKLD